MASTAFGGWKSVTAAVGRLATGALLATSLVIGPMLADGASAAASGARGQLIVSVVGGQRGSSPVCITLRDRTENMVVGSYCDGDKADRDRHRGRISLDLPRRSFAIDARAPGATVESISPRHFELGRRQVVVVRLDSKK